MKSDLPSSKYKKVKLSVIDAKDYVKCTIHNGYAPIGYAMASYVLGDTIYGDGSDYNFLIGMVAGFILLTTKGGYHTYGSYKRTKKIIEKGKMNYQIANRDEKEYCDVVGIELAIKEAGGLDACIRKKEVLNQSRLQANQTHYLNHTVNGNLNNNLNDDFNHSIDDGEMNYW